jgi:hypothetical protein
MTINTLAALAWGLLTVNTQTGEYTVIRGIDSQAQCARARTYGFCPDSIKSRRPDSRHFVVETLAGWRRPRSTADFANRNRDGVI